MYLEGPALAIHHQRAIKIAIEYKGIWRSFHPNLRPPFLFHPDIAINDRRIHYLNQKWGLKNTDKNSLSSDSLDDMVIYDSENKTLILSTDTIGMSDSALTRVINMGVAQSLLSSNRPRSISQEEAQILHTIERQLAEMGYNQQDLSILMLGFRKKVVDEEGKIIAEIGNAAINHSFNKLFSILFSLVCEQIHTSGSLETFKKNLSEFMPIDLVKEDDNYWNISVNYLYLLKDLLSSEDNPTMLNLLSSFATGDIQRVISTIKSIQVKFGKTPRRLVSSGEELLAHFLAILEKDLKSSQLHPGFSTKNFPNIWLGSTNFSRH